MISPISFHTPQHMVSNIIHNISKIPAVALPVIALAAIPIAYAGPISYAACVATCNTMASVAAPGLSYYTFKACMASCWWSGGPGCP